MWLCSLHLSWMLHISPWIQSRHHQLQRVKWLFPVKFTVPFVSTVICSSIWHTDSGCGWASGWGLGPSFIAVDTHFWRLIAFPCPPPFMLQRCEGWCLFVWDIVLPSSPPWLQTNDSPTSASQILDYRHVPPKHICFLFWFVWNRVVLCGLVQDGLKLILLPHNPECWDAFVFLKPSECRVLIFNEDGQ